MFQGEQTGEHWGEASGERHKGTDLSRATLGYTLLSGSPGGKASGFCLKGRGSCIPTRAFPPLLLASPPLVSSQASPAAHGLQFATSMPGILREDKVGLPGRGRQGGGAFGCGLVDALLGSWLVFWGQRSAGRCLGLGAAYLH